MLSMKRVCTGISGFKHLRFLTPSREFKAKSSNEVNEPVQNKFRKSDAIPLDYRLIYRAPYASYLKICYSGTVASNTVTPILIGVSAFKSSLCFPFLFYDTTVISSMEDLLGISFALSFVLFQVCVVTFKYPLRIYENADSSKFILIYQSPLPWRNKKESIVAGELKKTSGIMPWHESLYRFRNRHAFLIVEKFARPVDLNNMMTPPKKNSSTEMKLSNKQ